MTSVLKSKTKIVFLCLFILLTCSACSSPRAADGKIKVDKIISSETIEVPKDSVNVSDIEDEDLKKELSKLDGDELITIEPMTFSEAFSNGWFDGLIVWPMAQMINGIASATDAGWGILITTLLIQGVVFFFTRKSQASTQRMQEIQPEIQRIQDKYKGKTDDRSRMMMAQETQKLYEKYDIHPFGAILVTFIQLPIMMGVYYAMLRSSSVIYGSFLGIDLTQTPLYGIQNLQWAYIVIYGLMIVSYILNMKLPQLLKKHQDKLDNVKKKDYLKDKNNPMSSMQTSMYFMTAIIVFMYLSWPIAMSFYWLVSSLVRTIFSLIMHANMIKKRKENQKERIV